MLLVLILTVISCISLSVWVSIETYLDKCDEFYTSIGVLEYIGVEYPNEDYYDGKMQEEVRSFDYNQILDHEEVISFDRNGQALGFINGFERFDNLAYYGSDAVLLMKVSYEVDAESSVTIISNWCQGALFSKDKVVDKALYVEGLEEQLDDELPGNYEKIFIAYVEKINKKIGGRMYYALKPLTHSGILNKWHLEENQILIEEINPEEISLDLTLEELSGIDSSAEVISEDGFNSYRLANTSIYTDIAKTLYVTRHSLNVTTTNNIEMLVSFNQHQSNLVSGRYFSENEYELDVPVCIINEVVAKRLDVKTGDTLPLALSVMENSLFSESFLASEGFDLEQEYEVIGIIRTSKEMVNDVFIPVTDKLVTSENQVGYVIGTIHLNNAGADTFYQEILERLPERFILTIYDQGYKSAAKPLEDIHRIAMLTAIASLLATIVVMFIYSYLYVYRQRLASNIMVKLGTGKLAVYRYFVYGMVLVSTVAAGFGAILSSYLFENIKAVIEETLSGYIQQDIRYSNSNLSIINRLEYSMEADQRLFIWIALSVILLTILCGIFFTYRSLKVKKKVKQVFGAKRKHYSSTVFSGFFKYSYLSVFRGGFRTLMVVFLLGAMIIFLGQLTNTLEGYKENIRSIQQETDINVQFTDNKGRLVNKANVEAFIVSDLIATGMIDNLSITRGIPYQFMGIAESEGVSYEIPPLEPPKSSFAYERFISDINLGPKLIFTNNIYKTPQFYYSESVHLEFLEGYSDAIFDETTVDEAICVIPDTMMEAKKITLGDTIKVYRHWQAYDFYNRTMSDELMGYDIKVVGVYENDTERETIYYPLEALIQQEVLYEGSVDQREQLFKHIFDGTSFSLKNTEQLDAFRELLSDYGISEVTQIKTHRSFLVINDKSFVSALDALKQQLKNIQVLYPILYVLIALASFIIAVLVTVSRQKELSIMRGLGVSKLKVFMTFFSEQMILCIVGVVVGCLSSLIMYGQLIVIHRQLIMAICLTYLLGISITLILMNRFKIMKMLKKED